MPDSLSPPTLVNETEATAILGLSVKTLRRWRVVGRGIRYIKLGKGGAVRYDPADLVAFIEAGRRTSTSES